LNRVYWRIIVKDYGKAIYKASSRLVLFAALKGYIKGYKSLCKGGILNRDISINNLIINKDLNNLSWSLFLINLDLAIREDRDYALGAKGKIGTRAFYSN
jgi:hypothetical protein